ncbi:DUF6994 family protein [Pseudarthrobacter scleromae]|uniref:DUF6994 family protein n=1 Tax=Pseudarthrobacter scleromae TaxID=158897 RepID=UPI0036274FBC
MTAGVDTTFDYHDDSDGRDPDKYSETLKEHHRILWSKELPIGGRFELAPEPRSYLAHRSHLGAFRLSSDAITTRLQGKAAAVIREIPENELPLYRGYTAGSAIVFPGIQIGRKQVINQARGFHPQIADRFDLTLECIRRHYLGELPNPLGDVLHRYADFFALFGDFSGYVKFFLLQDLVEEDGKTIRFFCPFENFRTPAVPKTPDEYLEYLRRSNDFITARNARIDREP